jgi:hypothetical protein
MPPVCTRPPLRTRSPERAEIVQGRLIIFLFVVGSLVAVPTSSVFGSSPPGSTAKSGSVGIRLIAVAQTAPSNPLAATYVVDRLAPGTTLTRSVEIDNDTRAITDVSVYPAAASVVRGNFVFAPGHGGNELSSWTSLSRADLRLAPGSKALDTITVTVPKDAASGQQYGVLWAQVSAPPTIAGGVTLVNRVGVRMYLSVGPGGAPTSNFAIGSLSARHSATGESLVVSTVHNSGHTTLDLSGNLTLSNGPDGLRAGPIAATLGTVLAPGVSEPITVGLTTGLPRGPWRVDLSLSSGSLQRSAKATITFPMNMGAVKASKATGFPALVVVIVVLFLLLLAALALIAIRRRSLRS